MSVDEIDPAVEDRLRRALAELASMHEPRRLAAPHGRQRRSRWLVAAVLIVIALGIGGLLLAVSGDSDGPPPVVTDPTILGVPDPATLRYQERLGDDVVAFVDDLSLAAPEVSEEFAPPVPAALPADPSQREARVIWIDDSDVVVRGILGEFGVPFDESQSTGDAVDIGIPGARFTDEQSAVIVYPVDGATRIVGTDDAFQFGRPDPDVSAEQLIELARIIGTTGDWDAQSPGDGVWLFESTVETSERATVVEQGPSRNTTLTRFDEPLSAEQFFAYASLRAEPAAGATVGDTAILANAEFTDAEVYYELISPFDVVEVSFVQPAIEELIEIAPANELDRAFDGVPSIPPRPSG